MREIDELERSNRNRILAGLAFALGLAVIGGLLLAPKGSGVPEEDRRILVIDDQTHGAAYYLGDLGFEALSGPLEVWQQEVAKDDPEQTAAEVDLAALLDFADRHGYGYLVLEQPRRFTDELAAIDLEGPPLRDDAHFAVLSVGDFASPHALSVDPPTQTVVLGPGPTLLLALFAQPRMVEALDPKTPSSDAQQRRLQLDRAIEAHERVLGFDDRAAALIAEVEDTLAGFVLADGSGRKPSVLHEPLAGALALPMADGRILLQTSALEPYAEDDRSVSLRQAQARRLQQIPAQAAARADARVDCPGFEAALAELAQIRVAEARDALFILEHSGRGTLYHLDPNADSCGLRPAGEFAFPDQTDDYFVVHRHGVASRRVEDHRLIVTTDDLEGELQAFEIPNIDSSSSLLWLGPRLLAFLVRPEPGQVDPTDGEALDPDLDPDPDPDPGAALVVVDLDQPTWPLLLPLRDPGATLDRARELQRIPGDAPALLLRWESAAGYHLSRLDLDRPFAELIPADANANADANAKPAPAPPSFTWTPVFSIDAHIRGFDIHPDGRLVALTHEGDLGVDVGVVPLPAPGGGAGVLRVLLDDAFEHREVGFRPGHDELLFRTRLRLEVPGASLLAAQALPF